MALSFVANSDLTLAIGLSQGFEQHLRIGLGTVPDEIPVVIAWYGAGRPTIGRRNTTIVHAKLKDTNYRRGYALNVATRHVTTPYVLLADADFLYPRLIFKEEVIPQDVVSRFYVARLTPQATDLVAGGVPWESLYQEYQGVNDQVFGLIFGSHNPCVYPIEWLNRLRGYDERLSGWGGEDDELTERTIRAGMPQVRIPLLIGDLYHEGSLDYRDTYRRGNTSRENLDVLTSGERTIAANWEGWGDME